MARLEKEGATGTACAANVLKAIRLIEDIEAERGLGLASTARAFADELAVGLKEAPGALAAAGGDVVKIMTIHASKGLEFPIVALADFDGTAAACGKLLVETCGPVARASLAPGSSLAAYPQLAKRAAGFVAEEGDAALEAAQRFVAGESSACSQVAYRAALARRAAEEELAEARRKLYVGLTRASEALVVALDAKAPSQGKAPSYTPLVDDIRSALCGTGDFPEGVAELPYGGTAPARFERVCVLPNEDEDASVDDSAHPARFEVPVMDECASVARLPWRGARQDVFSYSSIAPAHAPLASASDTPDPVSDADKATGLGSAFHRAAQYAIETHSVPEAARLDALGATYGLSDAQRRRLNAACARWFASETFAEACTWPLRRAEVPFFVRVGDAFMEGEIDLLCSDAPEGSAEQALVVDYKTGGSDDETEVELREKHLLQAQCYAYALLVQGYRSVELRFVRVEREDASGEPQTMLYCFTHADTENLASAISAARG